MIDALEPLHSVSLKEVFIERFEALILSGQLSIGERLPSERALALRLGVSRPVVHEGLVELAARGLVTIRPRLGTVVADYRRQGSLALLSSLVNQHGDALDPALLDGVLALRCLVETEAARLAAAARGGQERGALSQLIARESAIDLSQADEVVELDYSFHHLVALASGNPVYPMLVKSFEPAHRHFARQFFATPGVAREVFGFHERLVGLIHNGRQRAACDLMRELLERGRQTLAQRRNSQ